jgi:uncharacterized integral membrane protein
MTALYLTTMADPHHVAELDAFDVFTVRIYRSGLSVGALGLLLLGGALFLDATVYVAPAWVIVFIGTALSIANMHLYDKRIRWLISAVGWLGGALMMVAVHVPEALWTWVFHAGAGFVFVSMSGFALKEQFCFKIKFLYAFPVVLAGSLIPRLAEQGQIAGLMLMLAGSLYGVLAMAKMRMPLHFDIGNKAAYQI